MSSVDRRLPNLKTLLPAVVICLIASFVAIGCDSKSEKSSAAAATLPKVLPGTGVVRGKVMFTGTPPVMQEQTKPPCHPGGPPLVVKEEWVVVNGDGTLQNVFVYLKGVSADTIGGEAPVIDQVNCHYTPHVIGVQAGQPLRIKSSDDAFHNVEFTPIENHRDNLSMTKPGQEKTVTFERPEFIQFKCGVHPWMSAYVGVFASPFFTSTGETGKFELSHLPVGTYTIAAWHERYGEVEKQITVSADKPVELDLNFAP